VILFQVGSCYVFKKFLNENDREISMFLKKEKHLGHTLRALIALNWYKSKPTLLCLNFDYNKEKNFYSFSVWQDVTCQFNLLPPLLLCLLHYWLPG
jgi:hypothetical protein